MRISLVLIFFLSQLALFSQDKPDILWNSENKLTWENFEKRVGQGSFYKAFTYSGIRYNIDAPVDSIIITLEAYFLPNESWVYLDSQTDRLLNHEQRHFDIAEVYRRRMREEMQKFKIPVTEFMSHGYDDDAKEIFERLYGEMEAKQKEYDLETNHGIDDSNQLKWNSWIDDQLSL
jgi:hypothetical protein